MGTSYNPKIVTDGLVLNLDPANVKSYPAKQDPYVNNVSLMLSMDGANNSTTFTDSSQNALAVTAVADAKISTAQSKFGGSAAYFDGTGDYLTVANNAVNAFGLGDFTIECWVNFSALPGSNLNMSIANTMTSTGSATFTHWWLGLYNNAGTTRLQLGRHGNGAVFAYVNWTPALNTWYHIAVTRSSSSVISMFIDGVSQSVTTSGSNWANDFSATGILSIGLVATALTFNGYIDDFRLTKGIARYTASFTPPAAPLSLPGRLTDLTQGKNNQTLTGSPAYSSSNGGIMTFNGTTAYTIGARPTSLVNGGQITIALWAKWTTVGTTTSTIQVLVDNNHITNGGFVIQDRPDLSKKLTFYIGRDANGLQSTGIVGDGFWHNIVFTNNGSVSSLYVDGIFNNSLSEVGGLISLQTNITIGKWQGGTRYLNGSVGNVLFYNRALTAAEVFQNYNATKGRFG